jgi:hypothetical protein
VNVERQFVAVRQLLSVIVDFDERVVVVEDEDIDILLPFFQQRKIRPRQAMLGKEVPEKSLTVPPRTPPPYLFLLSTNFSEDLT